MIRQNVMYGVTYPAAPFQAWLLGLVAEERAKFGPLETTRGVREAARRVGIPDKVFRTYLRPEVTEIDEAIIDRAVTYEGSRSFSDLYPYGRATVVPPPDLSLLEAAVRTCGTPGCRSRAIPDGRFCEPCAGRLAEIRAMLEGDAQAFRATIKRKDARPTCTRTGCWEERLGSEAFCDSCAADGYVAEAAA